MFFELMEGDNAELCERSVEALKWVKRLEARILGDDRSVVGGGDVDYLWEDAETGDTFALTWDIGKDLFQVTDPLGRGRTRYLDWSSREEFLGWCRSEGIRLRHDVLWPDELSDAFAIERILDDDSDKVIQVATYLAKPVEMLPGIYRVGSVYAL